MSENIDFTVCVQPADDFTPLPSVADRDSMLEAAVKEFRKFLKDRDRQGQVIIGFRMSDPIFQDYIPSGYYFKDDLDSGRLVPKERKMNDDVKAFNDAIQQAFYSKYNDFMDQMGKEALTGAITKATIHRFFEQLRAQVTYIENLRPPEVT